MRNLVTWLGDCRRAVGRGVFPYPFAWILELPWRRLLLSPAVLVSRLPLRTDARVLELGAGSGYYSTVVSGRLREGNLVLLDLQPGMLARCRSRCERGGSGKDLYVVGDGAALPLADAQFDLVYLVTVLGEAQDRVACIEEARRVLKPGGMLSISEHLPDPDFVSLRAVCNAVARAGFVLDGWHGSRWAYTANFSLGRADRHD